MTHKFGRLRFYLSNYPSVIFVLSLFVISVMFLGMAILSTLNRLPERFDFTIYENQIERIEIVEWIDVDDYQVIITLDKADYPVLLKVLSETDFYQYGPGDKPEYRGQCFMISLYDGSHQLVGHSGYVHYSDSDEHISYYTNPWRYIKDEDLKALFAPYLGQ